MLWFGVAVLWIALVNIFKCWILLWTRLTGASDHSAVVSPRMPAWQESGAVRISAARLGVSSSVQAAGIDQWQPAKPCRQRSPPRRNQPRDGGAGVAAVAGEISECVFAMCQRGRECLCSGSWHRSCWRASSLTELPCHSAHPDALIQWTHLTFSYSCPLWLTQPNL